MHSDTLYEYSTQHAPFSDDPPSDSLRGWLIDHSVRLLLWSLWYLLEIFPFHCFLFRIHENSDSILSWGFSEKIWNVGNNI